MVRIKAITFFLVFLFVSIFLAGTIYAQESTKFRTVVIDAGHGGKDPGALGKSAREKDVVLAIALKVGNYIEKYLPDVKVIYTRKTDTFIPLYKRAEIANKNDADLFISIHANYISNPKIQGVETFALGPARSDENLEVAKKENSVIVMEDAYTTKYEGFDPNSAESYILFEYMQSTYLEQSTLMASLIQKQFKERAGRRDRGVKQAGFLVLRNITHPSVLVEVGFLSNRAEERYLTSSTGQTYIASAIFRAVRDFKKQYDDKNAGENVTQKKDVKNDVKSNDVVYRIQVASFKREIKKGAGIYKKFSDIYVFRDGGRYKYATGEANDYNEIQKQLEKVKKKVPGCFIVAFEKGKKIPVSEAKRITNQDN
ncbi:MAG: N-acetylmuramoyl-L-alanine amidase [Chlorobi bacterium]|nr:N-acetylmuramoyl-L-alanine amidase [Chlorobiota bacterium]